MAFSGSVLFNLVVSNEPNSRKLEAVLNLKTHVKKENVDLTQVQAYFEAISVLMDLTDQNLQNTTFSLLCHLVKRVSIQDSRTTLLHDHSFLVLHMIVTRIADPRASIKISAKRALEAYWLTAPTKVEQALVELGLRNRSPLIINECVVWLNTILTEVNRHFSLNPFMNALAEILVQYENNNLLVENIKILFANYYDLKQNRLHKFELQKILELHKVSTSLRTSIMGTDHVMKSRDKPEHVDHAPKLPIPSIKPPRPASTHISRAKEEPKAVSHEKEKDQSSFSSPVDDIVFGLQNYRIDSKVLPTRCKDADTLHSNVSSMISTFDGKETERNWTLRETHIGTLRSLIRGNAHSEFPEDLVLALKDISEGICKGLLSLRTTLSVSACSLVKEAAILLGDKFDPLIDHFTPTLIKLNASTKLMTSSNAHVAMCAIMANCSYGGKLLHKIQTASSEKGSNTRTHCGTWLKIFVVRSSSHGSLPHTEIIERVLSRLLSDPISPVRQSAKEAFWSLQAISKESAERLLTRLDANVVKGLERSKPAKIGKLRPELTQPKSSRPSIKDSIIAKNKELLAKRADSRLSSRNSSQRSESGIEFGVRKGLSRQMSDPSTRRHASSLPKKDNTPHEPLLKQRSFHNLHNYSKDSEKKPALRSVASTTFSSSNVQGRSTPPIRVMTTADPIFQFLSSSNEVTIKEGINLLKYAMIVEEMFPDEIKFYLRKVSYTHPECFRPLLESQPEIFSKTWTLMTQEDILRVCSIILPVSDEVVDRMIALSDREVYQSVGTIFTYIADFDHIAGEKHLAIQVIKHKSKILELLAKFTLECTTKIPVGDDSFELLAKPLFQLVAIFHSMPGYDVYKSLVKSLYHTNERLFRKLSSQLSSNCKREIESIAGIEERTPGILENEPKRLEENAAESMVENEPETVENRTPELARCSPQQVEHQALSDPIATELTPDDGNTVTETNKVDSEESVEHDRQVSAESSVEEAEHASKDVSDEDMEQDNEPMTESEEKANSVCNETLTTHSRLIDSDHVVGKESPREGEDAEHTRAEKVNDEMMDCEDKDKSPTSNDNAAASATGSENSRQNEGPSSPKQVVENIKPMEFPSPIPADRFASRAQSFSPKKSANPNIFASGLVTPMRNEFYNRLNPDPPSDLVENFAQVKITNRLNSIQSFIDKVDPLSKVSCKARPISIFEDTKVSGSPQKVKEYNYTELNWFNFLVARLALDKEAKEFDDYTIAEFDQLCEDLRGELSGKKFVSLLRYLQNEQSSDFDKYFVQEGLSRIEDSLHQHLTSTVIRDKLSGLIILKQLLINRENINFLRVWKTLVLLSEDAAHEIEVAINEAFDEALCGIFSSADMTQTIVKTICEQSSDWTETTLTYVLRCLFKLVAQKTMVLSITDDLLRQLHGILKSYIGHKKVEIRKNVVQTYGKLLRAARVSELTDSNITLSNVNKESRFVDEILDSMTGPQRKMVEYYSH